jgi:hypothetical protein
MNNDARQGVSSITFTSVFGPSPVSSQSKSKAIRIRIYIMSRCLDLGRIWKIEYSVLMLPGGRPIPRRRLALGRTYTASFIQAVLTWLAWRPIAGAPPPFPPVATHCRHLTAFPSNGTPPPAPHRLFHPISPHRLFHFVRPPCLRSGTPRHSIISIATCEPGLPLRGLLVLEPALGTDFFITRFERFQNVEDKYIGPSLAVIDELN